jgi:ribonucleotide reductase alpha subunit
VDFEQFLTRLRKTIRTSYQSIGDTMMAGGATDMERYKYLLGQAHALQLIDQEISNLLNPKEDKKDEQPIDDTNVIRFKASPEDETST